MYKNKKIGVVIPVYNEEVLIKKVLDTMPDFVDMTIVIDDKSEDKSVDIVEQYISSSKKKVILIRHTKNEGVGAAIVTGYKRAIEESIDITAVMAGDAQMDPTELDNLLEAVISNKADYVKGNRLFSGHAWQKIPKYRYLGNAFLSLFTKIASGYWHIADSQSGYTAITLDTLKRLNLDKIYKRYGVPNDILVHLNVVNAKVIDIPISPVYNVGEKSGIRLRKIIPTLSFLLLRRFFWRIKEKYIIKDFHPLVFFYILGILLFLPGLFFGIYLLLWRILVGPVATTSALFAAFLTISGIQFLLFAMWFDSEYNKALK